MTLVVDSEPSPLRTVIEYVPSTLSVIVTTGDLPSAPFAPVSPLSPFVILGTTVAVTNGLVALFGSVCVTKILSPFTTALSKVTDHVPSETVAVLTVLSGRVTLIVESVIPVPVIVVTPSIMASTIASLDTTNPD